MHPPDNPSLPLPALTTVQQSAIDLLVAGRTASAAARALGIHRNTIHRWKLFHPTFRLELARRRQEVWGASADRFRSLLRLAGTVFRDHLLSQDPAASLRAARSILLLAGQGRFAPDPDPVDLFSLLDSHVRLMCPETDANSPITTDQRKDALHNLLLLADYRDDLP